MKKIQKVFCYGIHNGGHEVIKALMKNGAINPNYLSGDNPNLIYFINHKGIITSIDAISEYGIIIRENYSEINLPHENFFHDGDILIKKNAKSFVIFKSFFIYDDYEKFNYYDITPGLIGTYSKNAHLSSFRLATPDEVKEFYLYLNSKGLEWNPDIKKFSKFHWCPEANEKFYSIEIRVIDNTMTVASNEHMLALTSSGNCFKHKSNAKKEAKKLYKDFINKLNEIPK